MVDYNAPLCQNLREMWEVKKCEKLCKHVHEDGLGTKYPFKGYVGHLIGGMNGCLKVRYNGGCIRNDEWYQGEEWQLPIIPPRFKIVMRPTWGWQIIDTR